MGPNSCRGLHRTLSADIHLRGNNAAYDSLSFVVLYIYGAHAAIITICQHGRDDTT